MSTEKPPFYSIDDKRNESRLLTAASIYFQTDAEQKALAAGTPALPEAKIIDISANGIHAMLSERLDVGALVPLVVQISDDSFTLCGEVRWVVETENLSFETGFLLLESGASDLTLWKESIALWLNQFS